jgi:transcriptional regulator with XRE-family HTH domain
MPTARTDWDTVYRLIGERIRDERRKQQLTQAQLANLVGLKRSSITNVEQGRQKLLVHTLIDIANSLSTPPTRFLSVFDENAKPKLPSDLSPAVRNWIMHAVGQVVRDHDER